MTVSVRGFAENSASAKQKGGMLGCVSDSSLLHIEKERLFFCKAAVNRSLKEEERRNQ
jgi:hypothetical protein